MADRVVLVNGLPASGKSTLATALAEHLGWTLLSKDALKEAIGGALWPRVASARLGGIALDTMYALAAELEGGAVLDSIWLSTRDRPFLEAGLATMGEPRVVEVWCEVPEAVARERFERRISEQHSMHERWRPAFWEGAGPITENPIRVDTSEPVDATKIAQTVLGSWDR